MIEVVSSGVNKLPFITLVIIAFSLSGCKNDISTENIEAASSEIMQFMKDFEGRGDLSDESSPTPPSEVLNNFKLSKDLEIELLLSEPKVMQPVEIYFDHRGRLWVVQYNQYPYPEGLTVTGVDHHLRLQFDKIPHPPPVGMKGADKITFFEDTDNDGIYDLSTDAITGLNIATGITLGRGKIWILNPPYLLAYPDRDDDGIPDDEPEVHLRGFGLEDTHAVANSLRWGPDGWLYGATGSTTTSHIKSDGSPDVKFSGQGIWRYHPESQNFELFAEGGGNTFHVEIDSKGRIYSGDNGTDRGMYYKQGAYYGKNWGKHGALTNPFAFGFLPNMELVGDKVRFTHAWIRNEGNNLPHRYDGQIIAINPLHNFLQVSTLQEKGSNFKTVDTEKILETDDHWFRPVDIKLGPDGAVYLADWYDSRLTHVDPRDTWHRNSGRIYRLKNKNAKQNIASFDLSKYTDQELIGLLSHPNRWFRQEALRQFGDRKRTSVISDLLPLLVNGNGQLALEALWAINLSGGFDEKVAVIALNHSNPFVRMWAIKLLGDWEEFGHNISEKLTQMAAADPHAEVRSQLACTAKRISTKKALPVISALLSREEDRDDPDIPLLIWWALESKMEKDGGIVVDLFSEDNLWDYSIVKNSILSRLMQRFVMGEEAENLSHAEKLIRAAPSAEAIKSLLGGLYEGLRGKDITSLPSSLLSALETHREKLGDDLLTVDIRQRKPQAIKDALAYIQEPENNLGVRLSYIKIFGEVQIAESIPVLLDLMEDARSSPAVKQAAILALQHYENLEIGQRVLSSYPDKLRSDPKVRVSALQLLASRASWTHLLLDEIITTRRISKEDMEVDIIQVLSSQDDVEVQKQVYDLWPDAVLSTASDVYEKIKNYLAIIDDGKVDVINGQKLFVAKCGVCHKSNGSGGGLGPDLTGYDRRNVKEFLLHVVDPDVDIREGYLNYIAKTNDGRTLIGRLQNREGNTTKLQLSSGEIIYLEEGEIRSLEAHNISPMPRGILEGMADAEIRDLFGYLKKARS